MPDYTIFLKPLLAALGFAIVVGSSFVGGCEYAKDKQHAKELAEVKADAKLEKKDAAQGSIAVSNFKAAEASYQQGLADATKKAAGKPLIIVKTQTAQCPQPVSESKNLETSKDPVNEKSSDESAVVFFSPDFMQLYDSTAQPGNAELRTRTYAASEAVTIDEGSALITKNNETCATYIAQLDALISRIEEKQKTFKEVK